MLPLSENAAAPLPTSFKLDAGQFAEVRRRMLIRLSGLMPLLVAGFLYLDWHSDRQQDLSFELSLFLD
jgi:hypothetical protein